MVNDFKYQMSGRKFPKIKGNLKKSNILVHRVLNGNSDFSNIQNDRRFSGDQFRLIRDKRSGIQVPVGVFVTNQRDLLDDVENWLKFYINSGVVPLTIYSKNSSFYGDGRHYPIRENWKENTLLLDLGVSIKGGVRKQLVYFMNYDDNSIERTKVEYTTNDKGRKGIGFVLDESIQQGGLEFKLEERSLLTNLYQDDSLQLKRRRLSDIYQVTNQEELDLE